MFPIKDNVPRMHKPYAVWVIIALNLVIFLYEAGMTQYGLAQFIHLYGVVPARYIDPAWAGSVGYPPGFAVLPLFSHMFLHGGFTHVLANIWTMWIFADNIEDVMGPAKFSAFYLLCGFAALFTHMMFNAGSTVPVVGASGAVAGVMGAYFLLYPYASVKTFIPLFLFIPLFVDIPAVLYLGIWFAMQLFSGTASIGNDGAGIAWWAHAGGFVAGMVLLPFFRDKKRAYYGYRRKTHPLFGR